MIRFLHDLFLAVGLLTWEDRKLAQGLHNPRSGAYQGACVCRSNGRNNTMLKDERLGFCSCWCACLSGMCEEVELADVLDALQSSAQNRCVQHRALPCLPKHSLRLFPGTAQGTSVTASKLVHTTGRVNCFEMDCTIASSKLVSSEPRNMPSNRREDRMADGSHFSRAAKVYQDSTFNFPNSNPKA